MCASRRAAEPTDAGDRPRILLLLPVNTYKAHDFLEAAERQGIEVVVGTDRRQVLAPEAPEANLTLDFVDVEGSAMRIVELHRERPLDAVVGVDDETVALAAEASRRLDLPHNPTQAVARTRDKHAFRRALEAAGLPCPGYRLVSRDADPGGVARQVDYPCVLKPTFLSASRGVIRADDPGQFVAAWRRIGAILDEPDVRELGGAAAGSILVEDYVPGEEFAVEALLEEGCVRLLALFDKPDPLEGPVFEETIYVTPSTAPEAVRDALLEAVGRGVEAIGLRHGPIHAEARVDEGRVVLIDLAARTIGGLCSRALRFGTGLSEQEIVLRQAVGDDVASHPREGRASGVMMIPIPREGILERVDGLEAARAVKGVDAVTISIPRGQPVVPLPEGNRYLGFVFARGQTPREVEEALREAHRRLQIQITDRERE